MSAAGVCIMLQLTFTPPGMDPGKAVWNLDGSWTVENWPTIEEVAKKPAVFKPPEPSEKDKQDGNFALHLKVPDISYYVLMARALVSAHKAGKLWENPAADNTCPEQ